MYLTPFVKEPQAHSTSSTSAPSGPTPFDIDSSAFPESPGTPSGAAPRSLHSRLFNSSSSQGLATNKSNLDAKRHSLQRRELRILLAVLSPTPIRLHPRPPDLRRILQPRVGPAQSDQLNGTRRHWGRCRRVKNRVHPIPKAIRLLNPSPNHPILGAQRRTQIRWIESPIDRVRPFRPVTKLQASLGVNGHLRLRHARLRQRRHHRDLQRQGQLDRLVRPQRIVR
jgi:hypothetical protein